MSDEMTPDYALLDRAGVGSFMFYPRPSEGAPPPGATDHLIDVEPGVRVAARLYVSHPSQPTLLYFHGNGEIASDHDGVAPLYHEIGLNLCVAEFRGYGASDGDPSVAALVGDAHPLADFFHATLDEQGFSPSRFVMGRSLGAHPALELAATDGARFQGLILESGAGSIRRMMDRMGLLDTEAGGVLAAAHEVKIRSIALPVLLIHGGRDDLVPLRTAEELQALLTGTASSLVVIPGAGHNDMIWVGEQQYFEAIRRFVADSRAERGTATL
jgi:hypothetical protein